jgi:cell division protein FtsZ
LLEAQIDGAKSAIINVTGGATMSAYDASEAVDYIRDAAGNDIDIIFGVAINDKIGDSIIVSVIATGFDLPQPTMLQKETKKEEPTVMNTAAVKPAPAPAPALQEDDDVAFEDDDNDPIPSFFRRG